MRTHASGSSFRIFSFAVRAQTPFSFRLVFLGPRLLRGPCLRRDGWTALHYAAAYGNLPTVHALINAGASLNIQDHDRWAFGGRRGLGAVGMDQAAAGAAGPRRCTPLHLAACYANADATAALIGAGADATIENRNGYTTLHRAAPHGLPPQPRPRCPQGHSRAMGTRLWEG